MSLPLKHRPLLGTTKTESVPKKGGHSDEQTTFVFGPRMCNFLKISLIMLTFPSALKLRYTIPVYTPPSQTSGKLTPGEATTPVGSPQPTTVRFPTVEPPITFDAPLIARKESGWEDMLEVLTLRWLQAVVDERRGNYNLRT